MLEDDGLIQIVDAALAEAGRKAGAWLVCHPGCFECCLGPFPITPQDAARLRHGLAGLESDDPARAARVRARAAESAARLERDFPGDTVARLLDEEDAAAEEPCPALDPETGTCDLYAARPMTCRTFGPPVHFRGEEMGICELCFDGAGEEEIAACEVPIDADSPEGEGTIVAFALR